MRGSLAGVFRQPGARVSIALGVGLAVIVAVIFVLVHVASSSTTPRPNAAERTIAAFYADVSRKDYAAAYAYLAPQQQARITESTFAQIDSQLDQSAGSVTSYQEIRYDLDTNASGQATIQERVSRPHEQNYVVTFQMIGEANGSWLILDEDRPI